MKKKLKKTVSGEDILLETDNAEKWNYYVNYGCQFDNELASAKLAGVKDGKDPNAVLIDSLALYGISQKQMEAVAALLKYVVVVDGQKNAILPHFKIPHILQDPKHATSFVFGVLLLITVPMFAVYSYVVKAENQKEVAQATEVVPEEAQAPVQTAVPSKYDNLMASSIPDPSHVPETEPVASDVRSSTSVPTTTIQQVRDLILSDDEQTLESLFSGSKILIEAAGFCSNNISEEAYNLISQSDSKIELMYDGKLLKKIIIN